MAYNLKFNSLHILNYSGDKISQNSEIRRQNDAAKPNYETN